MDWTGDELETIDADSFGAGLRGVGINLVVRDVRAKVDMLGKVFGVGAHQVTDDFAIMTYGDHIFQLHADGTYAENPLLGVLNAVDVRGPGVEVRFYDTDPDEAVATARSLGLEILQEPTEKPHGLCEAYIVCSDGYVWVPSRPTV